MGVLFACPGEIRGFGLQSVNILHNVLNLAEPVEELLTRFENVLAEDVFLAVHVEKGESWSEN